MSHLYLNPDQEDGHEPPAAAGPEPVGLNVPPLTRAEYLERAERISPTPRIDDAAGPEPMPDGLDCGDNSCMYARKKGGMRTNGGCRCELTLNPGKANELRVEMHHLRRALHRAGLAIVKTSDVPSAEERRVLEGMAGIEIEVLEHIRDGWSCADPIWYPAALAELARRAAKEKRNA